MSFLIACITFSVRGLLAYFGPSRVRYTEIYQTLLVALLIVLTIAAPYVPLWAILAILIFIIYEIVGWSIFDVFVESKIPQLQGRRSDIRSFMWAVYTYAITIWVYGIFYWRSGQIVSSSGASLHTLPQAIYYSAITMATVGYGDYYPHQDAALVQIIAALEPLVGVVILILYFAVLVSGLSEHFRRSLSQREDKH